MEKSAGSYEFDQLQNRNQNAELTRLKRQAQVALGLEQKIWNQAGLTSGMNILDLGCGSGVTSCEIAKITNPGKVTGVDISESMIKQANFLKETDQISNITFQQGNAYELEFPENSFDFIYSRLLFQHLADPIKVVTNLYRILKPSGIVCLLDIDDSWLTVYPEPDSFNSFHESIVVAQRSQGGDPYVGKKMGSYCHQVGFINVKTNVEVVTSDQIGVETLLNLSFDAPYQFPRPDLAEIAVKGKQDLQALINLPYAWVALGVFVAMGQKPKN